MLATPDYTAIADQAIKQYRTYTAANPSRRSSAAESEPESSAGLAPLDFDQRSPPAEDRYLYGNFVEGTWVSKLESELEGEEGLYNVAASSASRRPQWLYYLLIVQIDPSLRTPYSLLLPTKDYHEHSAPLRPAYLTHAHRLLVAMEDGLERAEELGRRKVVAVYDCGEKSGVRIGHKCVRFFMVDVAAIAHTTHHLPGMALSSAEPDQRVEAFTALLNGTSDLAGPFIPKKPHYNLIMSREEMTVVPREDDGFMGRTEGRWDGARLLGVAL